MVSALRSPDRAERSWSAASRWLRQAVMTSGSCSSEAVG